MMMNVERGKYIGLTETGARIWELLEEPRSVDYLCTELCREYEITSAICRTEIDAFVTVMSEQGALFAT